jgi:hypothetical protein
MRNRIRTLALAAVFGAGALGLAARADDLPAPGKAPSARACVEGMIACAKKDDIDGMCSFMTEPYRSMLPKLITATKKSETADDKLKKAVEAKFGAEAVNDLHLRPKQMPKMMEGEVVILEVKEDGDKAEVKTKETKEGKPPKEETIDCVKQEGFWFANPPQGKGRKPADAEQEAKAVDVMSGAVTQAASETETLAGDVEGGSVASKEDLKARYGAIQMKMMQAMMASGMARKKGAGSGAPPAPKPEKEGE